MSQSTKKNMATPKDSKSPYWLMTADRRSARLLVGTWTDHGRLHLEAVSTIHEEWVESEHGRPSSRSVRDIHGTASEGHEEEERTHRFAKEIATWLDQEMESRGIARVECFCARKLLGALRGELPDRLRQSVFDHATDLAKLSAGELAKHPAVLAAVEIAAEPRE